MPVDLAKFQGRPPYAAELFGVYRPLIGWRGRLSGLHVARQQDGYLASIARAMLPDVEVNVDAVVERIGIGRLEPSFARPALFNGSRLLEVVRKKVGTIVFDPDTDEFVLPADSDWRRILQEGFLQPELDKIAEATERAVRDLPSEQVAPWAPPGADPHAGDRPARRMLVTVLLEPESQLAGVLDLLGKLAPWRLNGIVFPDRVNGVPEASQSLLFSDPLAGHDPSSRDAVLSPIGVLHLFRQYFFELDTFLGQPVEHLWLSPGATVELIDTSRRRVTVEKAFEQATETTTSSEMSAKVSDELSEAVSSENRDNTKFGVSLRGSYSSPARIYQAQASADFSMDSTSAESKQDTHKHMMEQSQKLSSEIRRSVRSSFKTITETESTSSKRYVITNPGTTLINYELRRKMRRVGVQVADLGTQLCWHVYLDDPGAELGLAKLVHLAQPADLDTIPPADQQPYPPTVSQPYTCELPWQGTPKQDNDRNAEWHEDYFNAPTANPTSDPNNPDKIRVDYLFSVAPPAGMRLVNVTAGKVAGNKLCEAIPSVASDDEFLVHLRTVNFDNAQSIQLEVTLFFEPTAETKLKIDQANKNATSTYQRAVERATKEAYVAAVRDRIEAAGRIAARPDADLREEERTIVYRQLLHQLMLDSWSLPDTADNRRLHHVRSELLRSIFDIDEMLYFVAPEWWMPRRHQSHQQVTMPTPGEPPLTQQLTADNQVGWGGIQEQRDDNYYVTDKSQPAPLGSSLGWLLQLDGDTLRNAFLNAPWVKAVIPIRPGNEAAALAWLKAANVEGIDGLDAPYAGPQPEGDSHTIGEVLEAVAAEIAGRNTDFNNQLAAEKVYHDGFDPLQGGFNATAGSFSVFDQWLTVLPTDQIVAMEYDPAEHLE
jgi:hypothetical protein